MSTLDVVGLSITVIIPFIAYAIIVYKLTDRIKELENFIMAQKDVVTYNRVTAKSAGKTEEDRKKEKEKQDMADYMRTINSGIVDDKDIKRFGTVNVDQG